jgi:hypothetical protein
MTRYKPGLYSSSKCYAPPHTGDDSRLGTGQAGQVREAQRLGAQVLRPS